MHGALFLEVSENARQNMMPLVDEIRNGFRGELAVTIG